METVRGFDCSVKGSNWPSLARIHVCDLPEKYEQLKRDYEGA